MNFKRYVEASDTWLDSHYIMGTDTDTITTPADIYANDTTATVGLKGNMEQLDTPTPTNPIQPSECGERTGNLFDKNGTVYSATLNSKTSWSYSEDSTSVRIPCEPNTTYTLSVKNPLPIFRVSVTNSDDVPLSSGDSVSATQLFNYQQVTYTTATTLSDSKYLIFQGSKANIDNWINELMVNIGSTALPYEPHGIKILILSNSTTTPVYLGEVESTRIIKKLVLTGNETFTYYNTKSGKNVMNLSVPDSLGVTSGNDLVFCTHLPRCSQGDIYSETVERGISTRPNSRILFYDTAIANAPAAFKTYLQQQYANGTPVTVWYVLAEPTTGIVNEPIRKIGDYADEVSGITIPTIAGANTISIGTTLQPSEVTVNYKGWHPVADVHERESGQWD